MRPILTTLALIACTVIAIAATVATGSLRAAGVLVLLWILAVIWAVRQAEWNSVRSLLADIQHWHSGD